MVICNTQDCSSDKIIYEIILDSNKGMQYSASRQLNEFFIVAGPFFPQNLSPVKFCPKNFSLYIDTKCLQKRLFKYYTHKVQLQKKFHL